jgi:hypothetical protein
MLTRPLVEPPLIRKPPAARLHPRAAESSTQPMAGTRRSRWAIRNAPRSRSRTARALCGTIAARLAPVSRPSRLGLLYAPHRCARVRVAVLDTTPVNVIITDQDDLLEDDLIGVACTSVHGGSRWLDLIREGVTWVVGAVKLQVVFQLQSPSGVVPSPLIAANGYRSVNSTGGADPKASCPTDWKVTDCTCKAQASDSGECAYLQFSGNEQACSSPGANAQTVLGARCVNGAGLTLSNVASTQDSAAVAGVRRAKRHVGLGRVGAARGAAGVRRACTPPPPPPSLTPPTHPPTPPGGGDGELY